MDFALHELDENEQVTKVTEFFGVHDTAKVTHDNEIHEIPNEMALHTLTSPAAADILLGNDYDNDTIIDEIEIKYEVTK